MLSRTAENLYWTARYIERADSIARLLEVAYRIHLIPNTTEGYQNEWESILAAAGIKHNYLNTNNEIKHRKGIPMEMWDDAEWECHDALAKAREERLEKGKIYYDQIQQQQQ